MRKNIELLYKSSEKSNAKKISVTNSYRKERKTRYLDNLEISTGKQTKNVDKYIHK